MPKTDKTTAITGDSVYKMAKAYAKKAGEHTGMVSSLRARDVRGADRRTQTRAGLRTALVHKAKRAGRFFSPTMFKPQSALKPSASFGR